MVLASQNQFKFLYVCKDFWTVLEDWNFFKNIIYAICILKLKIILSEVIRFSNPSITPCTLIRRKDALKRKSRVTVDCIVVYRIYNWQPKIQMGKNKVYSGWEGNIYCTLLQVGEYCRVWSSSRLSILICVASLMIQTRSQKSLIALRSSLYCSLGCESPYLATESSGGPPYIMLYSHQQ